MAIVGSGNDIIIQIPNKGDRDWADLIRTSAFQRLVEHDHTGSGRGRPINTNGLANDSVNDLKILLRNNEWLRAAGQQQNDPDFNILRVNPAGDLEIAPQKLVMSNGVVLDNNGADSSRIEGEITISDDLHLESNLLGPNLIQTSGNGIVSTKNVHLDPSDADPVAPMDGQLQYSDGTHRAAGLWQYMSNVWVQIKRNFISEPISDLEIKLQNDGWLKARNSTNDADINIVRVNALDEIEFGGSVTAVPGVDSVGTPELKDNAVTTNKLNNNSINRSKILPDLLNKTFTNAFTITPTPADLALEYTHTNNTITATTVFNISSLIGTGVTHTFNITVLPSNGTIIRITDGTTKIEFTGDGVKLFKINVTVFNSGLYFAHSNSSSISPT